jgi:phosphatidylserine/phosphatidylglycerophosphate/cardiolipin synthase-like enzyme
MRWAPALLLLLAWPGVRAQDRSPLPAHLGVCFVPPDPCGLRIADAVRRARRSLLVQAYGFDFAPIGEALIQAHRGGVDVQVLLDRSNLHRRESALPELLGARIPTFIDDPPGIAHSKIIIIDSCLVIGGSFNFTNAAEYRNAENVTFIAGCAAAEPFVRNWQARRAQAVRVP